MRRPDAVAPGGEGFEPPRATPRRPSPPSQRRREGEDLYASQHPSPVRGRIGVRERLVWHRYPEELAEGLPPLPNLVNQQPLGRDHLLDLSRVAPEDGDGPLAVSEVWAEDVGPYLVQHLREPSQDRHEGQDPVEAPAHAVDGAEHALVPPLWVTHREHYLRVGVLPREVLPEEAARPVRGRPVSAEQWLPLDGLSAALGLRGPVPTPGAPGVLEDLVHVKAGPETEPLEGGLLREGAGPREARPDNLDAAYRRSSRGLGLSAGGLRASRRALRVAHGSLLFSWVLGDDPGPDSRPPKGHQTLARMRSSRPNSGSPGDRFPPTRSTVRSARRKTSSETLPKRAFPSREAPSAPMST